MAIRNVSHKKYSNLIVAIYLSIIQLCQCALWLTFGEFKIMAIYIMINFFKISPLWQYAVNSFKENVKFGTRLEWL